MTILVHFKGYLIETEMNSGPQCIFYLHTNVNVCFFFIILTLLHAIDLLWLSWLYHSVLLFTTLTKADAPKWPFWVTWVKIVSIPEIKVNETFCAFIYISLIVWKRLKSWKKKYFETLIIGPYFWSSFHPFLDWLVLDYTFLFSFWL